MTDNLTRESILEQTMDELGALRQAVLALPDGAQIEPAIEAIDFFERGLPGVTGLFDLLEMCTRAIADIQHELAAAEYGFESPEAEAVFDQGECELSECLRTIWAARDRYRAAFLSSSRATPPGSKSPGRSCTAID